MWLEYGIDKHGELVYIGQAKRGKTGLVCPYCGGELLARKGEILIHHFAHAGATCRAVDRDPDAIALPAYDDFSLHLPGCVLEHLRNYHAGEGGYNEHLLLEHNLIALNKWAGRGGNYELTKKGKLILAELSLMLFNDFQQPLIEARHTELEARAIEAYNKPQYEARLSEIEAEAAPMIQPQTKGVPLRPEYTRRLTELNTELWAVRGKLKAITLDLDTALIDLRLYRAQWRRILACTLYFLEVQASGETLHKIGVTTRSIDERISEIQAELTPLIGPVQIKVLGTWEHRGNVERYFKYRYKAHNKPIGNLTEYYALPDVKPVLLDLRRMKPKSLTEVEHALLAGELSGIENKIRVDAIEHKRRTRIKAGLQRRISRGQHVGRPIGSKETAGEFLAKPESIRVQQELAKGGSLRTVAKAAEASVNTVRKVQRAMTMPPDSVL